MLTATFRNFLKTDVYQLNRTTFDFIELPLVNLYNKPNLQFRGELRSFLRTAELVI